MLMGVNEEPVIPEVIDMSKEPSRRKHPSFGRTLAYFLLPGCLLAYIVMGFLWWNEKIAVL